ncbi:MAG: caspase family protein [Caldilineaceae bacterium]|nr:caspase family protein [Caldilineaceae bacterium]
MRQQQTDHGAQRLPRSYYNKSWGLVIGINHYQGGHPLLANARNDAVAFATLLRDLYHFDQVITLFDEAATGDTLMDWLRDRLPAQVGEEDRLIIFFAGHGTTRKSVFDETRGYLIPSDAEQDKYASYIDLRELRDACSWIHAKHILLILDCCFSGIAAVTARVTPPLAQQTLTDAYLQEITRRSAWQVLTAGASDELVDDSGDRPGHSAFTSALLAGLEG